MEMYAYSFSFLFHPNMQNIKLCIAQKTIVKNGKNNNFHSESFIILNKSQPSPWQNDKWICQVVDAHFNGCSRYTILLFFPFYLCEMNGIHIHSGCIYHRGNSVRANHKSHSKTLLKRERDINIRKCINHVFVCVYIKEATHRFVKSRINCIALYAAQRVCRPFKR